MIFIIFRSYAGEGKNPEIGVYGGRSPAVHTYFRQFLRELRKS
jgi:hypothetical protein